MRRLYLSLGLVALLGPAASAQVITLGTSDAKLCYEASMREHPDPHDDIRVCSDALRDAQTSRRDRAATYVNMGIIQARLGRNDDALASYNDAIDMMPGLAEAYLNRGALHLRENHRLEDAVADFDRSLELGLNEPYKAHYNRALAYESLGQLEQAFADLNTAVAMRPDWQLAQDELARYTVSEQPRS